MIQVYGKTILSMEFNPILKAHGSSPWQLLIKAYGKSHGNYLYFTNIQVIIQDLHPRNGKLCKRTFLIHHGSCQNFATSLINLLPLLHGESQLKNVLMKNYGSLLLLSISKNQIQVLLESIQQSHGTIPNSLLLYLHIYLATAKV